MFIYFNITGASFLSFFFLFINFFALIKKCTASSSRNVNKLSDTQVLQTRQKEKVKYMRYHWYDFVSSQLL